MLFLETDITGNKWCLRFRTIPVLGKVLMFNLISKLAFLALWIVILSWLVMFMYLLFLWYIWS